MSVLLHLQRRASYSFESNDFYDMDVIGDLSLLLPSLCNIASQMELYVQTSASLHNEVLLIA